MNFKKSRSIFEKISSSYSYSIPYLVSIKLPVLARYIDRQVHRQTVCLLLFEITAYVCDAKKRITEGNV